jgi:hypothetical protein
MAVESRLYAVATEKRFSLLYCRIVISIKPQNTVASRPAHGYISGRLVSCLCTNCVHTDSTLSEAIIGAERNCN